MNKVDVTRSSVSKKDCWDLAVLFSSIDEWNVAMELWVPQISKLAKYQGGFADTGLLLEYIHSSDEVQRNLEVLYTYASYQSVVDLGESKYQAMEAKVIQVFTQFSAITSFAVPELTRLDDAYISELLADERFALYELQFKCIQRMKSHTLTEAEEAILAKGGNIWGDNSDIFSKLNNVDLKFTEAIDEKGGKHTLTHGSFGVLLESYDESLRQNAYENIYAGYKAHQHTLAQTLYAQMKQHHFFSQVRNYETTLDAALFPKAIDKDVYVTLIKGVNDNLPLLHKYMEKRAKLLKKPQLNMWDMKVPLVKDLDWKISYDEAVEMVCAACAPLGDEYIEILREGLASKRWVDKYENTGKRSGAFSGGCHDTYPYILLNYTGTLNDVYTLAHEAGHSMHSYLARQNQPYHLSDYTIFTAEIASTLNERLLTEHLLTTCKGKKREYLITYEIDALRSTFFRQTQFAEFELLIHQAVEQGHALSADFLNAEYTKLNDKYYGKSVIQNELIQYEWSRIPHFYYNYYVYQYATGITCAYNFADRILADGQAVVDIYLDLLKSGGNDFPLNQLKKAGIDMTDTDLYAPIFRRWEWLLAQL
jgi:oligoendopeptidase F